MCWPDRVQILFVEAMLLVIDPDVRRDPWMERIRNRSAANEVFSPKRAERPYSERGDRLGDEPLMLTERGREVGGAYGTI
jgi:hypothetical protein